MKKVFVLLALLGLSGSGCDGLICDDGLLPAVMVHVFDADTGEPMADEVLAILREGTFVDTLVVMTPYPHGPATTLRGPWERAGVYSLTITRQGYAMWERDNIHVPQGTCHVQTAELTAELQPVE